MAMKTPIILEKKPERLADNMAAMGMNELRISLELLVGLWIKPEATGHELPLGLRMDSGTGLSLSCI
jgi:hypothetical protein